MNIFVSRPTVIDPDSESAYQAFHDSLVAKGFALRRLGGGDFSKKAPLRAVIDLVHQCCGALVLGYPQIMFEHQHRRGVELQNSMRCLFPTPWNQIEGALAYASQAPTMVVAHPGIAGGVFDHGITGECVIHVNLAEPNWYTKPEFAQPFEEWLDEVRVCHTGRMTATGTA